MSEEERLAFLASERVAVVASLGPRGWPHSMPLWFVVREGELWSWTYGSSQKIVNLRRDPRIVCLVEDGVDYFELRGVSITGRATLVEDYDDIRALGARVATRMADGADLGEFGDQIVAQQARKRVGVIVEPDTVASWDHRKMTAPPGAAGGGNDG